MTSTAQTATTLSLPVPHPATEGHFPRAPILPGVVLLDEAVRVIERALGTEATRWRVSSVKFLSPAAPQDSLRLVHERLASGAIRFTISAGERTVATGQMSPP
jgi:3-hydroxymyristoyl/3-hydroxydecanoyl-(acyl carrier protein) dehydratase